MGRFKIILAMAVVIASTVLLVDSLFRPSPIQIILETGQEVTSQSADYYPLGEVLMLVVASFLMGSSAIYLYYNSETPVLINSLRQKKKGDAKYDMVMPLLKGDERKVFAELLDSNGEMLQNALVLKTGLSKVKVTRVLAGLEKKNLVTKERYGLTNRVKLK